MDGFTACPAGGEGSAQSMSSQLLQGQTQQIDDAACSFFNKVTSQLSGRGALADCGRFTPCPASGEGTARTTKQAFDCIPKCSQ
ncbi:hypothetical protein [Xanthomonas phaseoli]|uniref:Uncharacterized protein n=2 Tax=Xanthomonas TaxID=338 RepID=A0A8I1XIY3_XANMN|nr:hypothetical protein [Xanthomonas phaseoli]KUF26974.1 hypothetical protein AO826_08560 [Xanthomonas phaseoli pv. manihotis]MBO9721770.1 hypothetical protein [Xanthomonas phaseoli pv. manihotis]MBO9757324.1 hypothetical protein [Xanthomonas phaseoli pv. manihotis]MBO9758768.1 hypothetical protein [Xanthomonas phaseoli pv. manihotis]MBO9763375.1 hypothetical protein [Xanthomonas phaseoli pv. manihotis]